MGKETNGMSTSHRYTNARRNDPESSHEAGRRVEQSGAACSQRQQVRLAVETFNGYTSRELADATGLDRYMIVRRLPELESRGLVKRGELRRCSIAKRRATTWWIAASCIVVR